MQKDSKFIGYRERRIILKAVQACSENQIIITHGTMTMAKTARYLQKRIASKTIVFVGSLILGDRPDTDAPANLKFATEQFASLLPGVYVAMNIQVFEADNVRKNLKTGQFETIRSMKAARPGADKLEDSSHYLRSKRTMTGDMANRPNQIGKRERKTA